MNEEEKKQKRKEKYHKDPKKYMRKAREWREANKEKRNAGDRARNAIRRREDPEWREKLKDYRAKDYIKHKEKRLSAIKNKVLTSAHDKVYHATKTGVLTRPDTCSSCGVPQTIIHGHHVDYSKPLDVVWLCTLCHGETRQS
jgi:hypothetical protein